MTQVINRQTFDDVMVPNYSPLSVIPVRGQGPEYGTEKATNTLTLHAGLP